jgi:pimeloyl-ACP methyl ester carboxylesterase
MRPIVALAVVLLGFPASGEAQELASGLFGPTGCVTGTAAPPPPASLQSNGLYSSWQPYEWQRFCAEQIEGIDATGTYRAEIDLFRQSYSGDFSFSVTPAIGSAGLGGAFFGGAIGWVQDTVTVTGGTGTGTIRLTLDFQSSATFTAAVDRFLPQLRVDRVGAGFQPTFFQDESGVLVAEYPFTFGVPLTLKWQVGGQFVLNQTSFRPGEGFNGSFTLRGLLRSVEIVGSSGQAVPGAQVTSSGGGTYPGPQALPDLAVAGLEASSPTVVRGKSFSASATIANLSSTSASATETRYYLSSGGLQQTYPIGAEPITDLAGGASRTTIASLAIPQSVLPGTYYLLGCADGGSVLVESNEANNCRASTQPISIVSRIPVVVVPGILGTALIDDASGAEWLNFQAIDPGRLNAFQLDENGNSAPTVRTAGLLFPSLLFGGLMTALQADGYEPDTSLFVFPYDWRFSNVRAAGDFRRFIDEVVLPQSGSTKVDLVVHSMGGLIARQYATVYGSGALNKVIYLGTPHKGAAKSFNALAFNNSLAATLMPALPAHSQTFAELSATMPSVFQLLPTTPFINSFFLGRQLALAESYQAAPDGFGFLRSDRWVQEARNFATSLGGPQQVAEFNIVGTGIPTLSRLSLLGDPSGGLLGSRTWCGWEANGDGTVPVESATGRNATNVYIDRVSHPKLPTDHIAAQTVVQILRDLTSALPAGATTSAPYSTGPVLTWCTGSPIRIVVQDQGGRRNGLGSDGSILEGIPDSSFFVFEHNEGGFLRSGQPYEFAITGTGRGTFDLVFEEHTDDGSVSGAIRFDDVPIDVGWRGRVVVGSGEPLLTLDTNADGVPEYTVRPGTTLGPSIVTPDGVAAEATGPSGRVVDFDVTATDPVEGALSPTCLPISGSPFPIGATTVTCSAAARGILVTRSFVVTVSDTTAPVLSGVVDITVNATGPHGAVVNFSPTAIDAVDASPTISCTPARGSQFAIGVTRVTCTAADDYQNVSPPRTFQITVKGAVDQVMNLIDKLAALSHRTIPPGVSESLRPVVAALISGKPALACRVLDSVGIIIRSIPSARVPAAIKEDLLRDLKRIQAVLGC